MPLAAPSPTPRASIARGRARATTRVMAPSAPPVRRLRASSSVDGAAETSSSSSSSSSSSERSAGDAVVAPSPSSSYISDVRVRILRDEDEVPRIATLCAAVFKEIAIPLPTEAGAALLAIGDLLEASYERAMIKDLNGVVVKCQREKRRAANATRAEFGRARARATAREIQALQRTRTSVDALTTEQLTEMRSRIADETASVMEDARRAPDAEYRRRRHARQWMQIVVDAVVPGGVATGLVMEEGGLGGGGRADDESERPPSAGEGEFCGREIVASATLQACVPDAPFPPPFPTSRPYRAYLANVAVAPEARRQGVASAIIEKSERVAKMWGYDELWLHVNVDNPSAKKLYERAGYAFHSEDPWFYLDRRFLLFKKLT